MLNFVWFTKFLYDYFSLSKLLVFELVVKFLLLLSNNKEQK